MVDITFGVSCLLHMWLVITFDVIFFVAVITFGEIMLNAEIKCFTGSAF